MIGRLKKILFICIEHLSLAPWNLFHIMVKIEKTLGIDAAVLVVSVDKYIET